MQTSTRQIDTSGGLVNAVWYTSGRQDQGESPVFVLAHGAGAGQASSFMVSSASGLAARGIDVLTFNFPYIDAHRKVPDRQPVLERVYQSVAAFAAAANPAAPLFVGGKSMGGRIATHVAGADAPDSLRGVVAFGYPLHPPGRPAQRRDAHLPAMRVPLLVIQGSRDAFGTPDEFVPITNTLGDRLRLHVVDGADHSFKRARASKADQGAVLEHLWDVAAAWMRGSV